MWTRYKRSIGILLLVPTCTWTWAGQLTAKLNPQLELLASCVINNQSVANQTTNLNLGQIDFGETNATFNRRIESSLSNANSSGLVIQCSGNSNIKLTFGAGRHDQNVPTAFAANYFRSMSNGQDYIAYNVLYGPNNQIMRPNDSVTLSNNGQAQSLRIIGQAINDGRVLSMGTYSDRIPVTIEF